MLTNLFSLEPFFTSVVSSSHFRLRLPSASAIIAMTQVEGETLLQTQTIYWMKKDQGSLIHPVCTTEVQIGARIYGFPLAAIAIVKITVQTDIVIPTTIYFPL